MSYGIEKRQNENNFICFYLHKILLALQMQNHAFMAISLVQQKLNQHELATLWSWYVSVQFICKNVQYSCMVFENFGGSYTNLKKTMTTFVGCVSYDKIQNSISKGQLLPITHNIQI